MTNKIFAVSDVHGFYNEMKEALDNAGFDPTNPTHLLVVCGDLLDRGPQPRECLEYVMGLPRKVLIVGNHELLMENAIARHQFNPYDYTNGTVGTAVALTGVSDKLAPTMMKEVEVYNEYIQSCGFYFETAHHIFVHGWIPCVKNAGIALTYLPIQSWRAAPVADWVAATWINGMQAWRDGVREPDHTVVCGHFHASWGNCYIHGTCREWNNSFAKNPEDRIYHSEPFIDEGIAAIDACTALSHKVNVYVCEDEVEEEE